MTVRERIFQWLLDTHHELSMQFILFSVRSLAIKDLAKITMEARKRWRLSK